MSKYGAIKTTIDGITFDSKREAERYSELKLLERAGKIKDLKTQPRFTLLEGFKKNGKTFKPIHYTADFMYYDNELKQSIVEDVKGFAARDFSLRVKMFESKYPDLSLKVVR